MGLYYSFFEWYNPLWLRDRPQFVNEHMLPQLKDLIFRYRPDILWADGEWEGPESLWRSREFLTWLFDAIAGKPSEGRAAVEAFFTAKDDTLYAILPGWSSRSLALKDVRPSGQTAVTMIGLDRPLKWTPIDGGLAVEVPQLSVNELPCEHAYTIRLTHLEGDDPIEPG